MKAPRRLVAASAVALAAITLPACSDSGDEAEGEPQTEVVWVTPPADTVALGSDSTASFRVDTQGQVHVAQLRACIGDVPTCGVDGDDVEVYASEDAGTWSASLTLPSAGTWTIVAWAHVDEDPHLSEPVLVTVQ